MSAQGDLRGAIVHITTLIVIAFVECCVRGAKISSVNACELKTE